MLQLRLALRRPLHPSGSLSSSLVRRCFSQRSILHATPKAQQPPPRPRGQSERSIRLMSNELQQVPSDMGIIDSTFVTPTGNNVPSLFRSPMNFLKLQYKRAWFKLRDQFSLAVLKFSSPKAKGFLRRSLKLSRSTIAPTAVALHRQMYSSFAEGDVSSLRKICSDGIFESLRARIGSRPRGEIVQWEIVKYNKTAKVVSDRGARLPMEGSAIRQAVVRICSKQKLTRWAKVKGGQSQVVPGSGQDKDVVEYVVIQQKLESWRPGPWQVWGTTRETTLRDVENWERKLLE